MKKINLNKLNVVYLSIQNKLPILLGKIFTKPNLNKVIIIFIVGFISRVFIVNIYNINVYFENLNTISILYYWCMSCFIVVVHELVNYFEFNIIPSYLLEHYSILMNIFKNIINFGNYLKGIINSANKLIFSLKLSEFKLSSIRKNFILYLNKDKMTLDVDIYDNQEKIEIIENIVNNNVLQKNGHTLKSSRGRSINNYNGGSSSNSNDTRNPRPREGGLFFLVDTIRDSVASAAGEPDRSLSTPEPSGTVSTPSIPTMPPAPNIDASNLSTPSMSTIKTNDMPRFEPIERFEPLPKTVYSAKNNNASVTNAQENNYTYSPVPNYVPVSTSKNTYFSTTNSSKAVYYPVNNSSTSANKSENYYGHYYDVPGQVAYFNPNPPRVSSDSNQVTLGSNSSNERYGLNTEYAPGPANWNDRNRYRNVAREDLWTASYKTMSGVDLSLQRNAVVNNYHANFEKEVFSPVMDNEVVIDKKGLLGRLKLAFNYGNKNLKTGTDNVDSIVVKYRDIAKRKFVWKIWEKKSGNYESYQDFKESWDPKTSIWEKIKEITKKDIQADVEGVLGINRNIKGLGHSHKKGLGVSNVRTEVGNLVRNKQPFSQSIVENGEQISTNNESSSRNKDSSHKSSSSHKHSSHKHSHSHSHSRSHSHTHSHSRSHSHNRHHNHRSHRNHTRQRSYSRERYI